MESGITCSPPSIYMDFILSMLSFTYLAVYFERLSFTSINGDFDDAASIDPVSASGKFWPVAIYTELRSNSFENLFNF